jgi:hypothetical protein
MTRVTWLLAAVAALAGAGVVIGLVMRSAMCAGPWLFCR